MAHYPSMIGEHLEVRMPTDLESCIRSFRPRFEESSVIMERNFATHIVELHVDTNRDW